MKKTPLAILLIIAILALIQTGYAADNPFDKAQSRPLKVYILVGQSNMQGHGAISTLQHLAMDPASRPLLDKIQDADGKARTYENVHVTYCSEAGKKSQQTEKKGPLTTGFGASSDKIGPELTFGITMYEKLQEPILIIKTAWGGKSLNTDFRPPSAGEHPIEKRRATSGVYYKQMLDYVNKVLADPGQYHPSYDAKQGCEIGGFVWLQGFNDSVDKEAYPGGDWTPYCELLCHFIRDVRNDLKAPRMPFVIGVIGTVGPVDNIRGVYKWGGIEKWFDDIIAFRKAMAAPADMPEFKGNVEAVWTENYMDKELVRLEWKHNNDFKNAIKGKSKEEAAKIENEMFTERELKVIRTGISNKAFHYFGSGKFHAQVGQAFAEAVLELKKK